MSFKQTCNYMALRIPLLVLLLFLSYQPSLSQGQRREVRLEIQPRLKHAFGLDHPQPVISPNDKLMLVGGLFAFVWELATEREIVRFDGHRGNVTAVIFSPDGETAFTAGTDETVRAWSIKTGREILKLDVQSGHVEDLAISPDSRLLITHGLGNSEAQVWDLSSRRLLRTLSLPASARTSATIGFESPKIAGPFAFSANGSHVLSGANDRIVRIWDLKRGNVLAALEGPAYGITYAALSFDAHWALAGSYSGRVRLFDLTTGKAVKDFFHGARHHDVCFSEDKQAVLYKSYGTVLAWELSTQKETELPPGRALCQYHSYTFGGSSVSRDLSFYANGIDSVRYPEGGAAGWNLRRGAGNIDDVWISSDGRWMRTNFPGDGFGIPTTWSLWDTTVGQPVYISTDRATHSYPFSVNGNLAVTADLEQVIFWENGQITRDFKINSTHPTGRTVLSRDGKRALSWVLDLSGLESTTQLWDVETGTELRKFSSPISPNNLAALSSNGKLVLMSFLDGVVMGVVILDTATGQELKRLLTTRLPDSLAISNDDQYVLTTEQQWVDVGGGVGEPTDGLVRLWDLRNGRELRHFQVRGAKAKMVAEFSPDGKWVTAKDERIVEIFEASTGRSVWWFDRLDRGVASVFSNDGRHLLLVDRTDRVRVINIQSGVEVATIVSTERGGWAVVSRDGRFDTNRDGLEGMMPLQWIVDDDPLHALPVEIFMRTHYQPQLLAQILAGESLPPLPDISSLNRAQPEVTIIQVKSTPNDPPGLT